VSGPVGPGDLARRLTELPVVIESHSVELGAIPVDGYYDGADRPTGVVALAGGAHVGRGENVDWTAAGQERFAAVCRDLISRVLPAGPTSLGTVVESLARSGAHPHHRAALEAAALDLALHLAGVDLFDLTGGRFRPIRTCRSIGREEVGRGGPLAPVESLLERDPNARIKIDCPPDGWEEDVWRRLAGTGRVVVVDFKREGVADQLEIAHRLLPDAWIEDPPADLIRRADSRPRPWLRRVALDGYVTAASDLEAPPFPPAAVNVKAPRVGGPFEALAILEICRTSGWIAYFGGMFEVSVGRRQARVLASLFTAEAWNDLDPLTGPASRHDPTPGTMPGFG
jgi:L-alanine-DL-glutamate epimerase-like enolase superfamily enzyme